MNHPTVQPLPGNRGLGLWVAAPKEAGKRTEKRGTEKGDERNDLSPSHPCPHFSVPRISVVPPRVCTAGPSVECGSDWSTCCWPGFAAHIIFVTVQVGPWAECRPARPRRHGCEGRRGHGPRPVPGRSGQDEPGLGGIPTRSSSPCAATGGPVAVRRRAACAAWVAAPRLATHLNSHFTAYPAGATRILRGSRQVAHPGSPAPRKPFSNLKGLDHPPEPFLPPGPVAANPNGIPSSSPVAADVRRLKLPRSMASPPPRRRASQSSSPRRFCQYPRRICRRFRPAHRLPEPLSRRDRSPRIPKGFRPPAQGCETRTTLGSRCRLVPNPTGLRRRRSPHRSHSSFRRLVFRIGFAHLQRGPSVQLIVRHKLDPHTPARIDRQQREWGLQSLAPSEADGARAGWIHERPR